MKWPTLLLKIFLITLCLYGQGVSFAQEEAPEDFADSPSATGEGRVDEKTPDPALRNNAAMEAVKGLSEQERKELLEAAQSGDKKKLHELSKKLQGSFLKGKNGKGPDVHKLVGASLKQFQSMSQPQVEDFLRQRFKGKLGEKIFKKFPKLLTLSGEMLRDPKALPSFIEITKYRNKLYIFLGINVFLWLVGWFVTRLWKNARDRNLIDRLFHSFKKFCILFPLRIAALYVLFPDQVTPMLYLFKRVF